jgi:hypothetical protein
MKRTPNLHLDILIRAGPLFPLVSDRRVAGQQCRSGQDVKEKDSFFLSGIESLLLQPVAYHYTGLVIAATKCNQKSIETHFCEFIIHDEHRISHLNIQSPCSGQKSSNKPGHMLYSPCVTE